MSLEFHYCCSKVINYLTQWLSVSASFISLFSLRGYGIFSSIWSEDAYLSLSIIFHSILFHTNWTERQFHAQWCRSVLLAVFFIPAHPNWLLLFESGLISGVSSNKNRQIRCLEERCPVSTVLHAELFSPAHGRHSTLTGHILLIVVHALSKLQDTIWEVLVNLLTIHICWVSWRREGQGHCKVDTGDSLTKL